MEKNFDCNEVENFESVVCVRTHAAKTSQSNLNQKIKHGF